MQPASSRGVPRAFPNRTPAVPESVRIATECAKTLTTARKTTCFISQADKPRMFKVLRRSPHPLMLEERRANGTRLSPEPGASCLLVTRARRFRSPTGRVDDRPSHRHGWVFQSREPGTTVRQQQRGATVVD